MEEGFQERREGGMRVESYGDTRGLWRAGETFPMVWRKLIGDVWSERRSVARRVRAARVAAGRCRPALVSGALRAAVIGLWPR